MKRVLIPHHFRNLGNIQIRFDQKFRRFIQTQFVNIKFRKHTVTVHENAPELVIAHVAVFRHAGDAPPFFRILADLRNQLIYLRIAFQMSLGGAPVVELHQQFLQSEVRIDL
ncbi:MAG TPA: hypothetical protein DE060_00870 [Lentisphaeria bacterium]|nr:hypothetical protein [Lentisphaeria bacterium]